MTSIDRIPSLSQGPFEAGMHLLITAGNTLALIDKVRCLTNIFTGKTGAGIALEAYDRGHEVTLLTSHPEVVDQLRAGFGKPEQPRWQLRSYRTFEDLHHQMEQLLPTGSFEVLIHCAAVSDYLCGGVFAPTAGTRFDSTTAAWQGEPPQLVDRLTGKVKSDEPELWLRLVRAPKLIDRVRSDWRFRGIVVKFKLEVGLQDEQLLDIAERSRAASAADLMVANTLEGASSYAFIGSGSQGYQRVTRAELAPRLLERVERLRERVG